MSTLSDKIKAARKIRIEYDGKVFTGNRATVEQALSYGANRRTDADLCRMHIDGWEGVKESDILAGGSDDIIPFDKEVFDMVIGDHQEWWSVIASKLLEDAYTRVEERKNNEKKSNSGLKNNSSKAS